MSLDIHYLEVGQEVTVSKQSLDASTDGDNQYAKENLKVGELYKIYNFQLQSSMTKVWLDGFVLPFNSENLVSFNKKNKRKSDK